MLNFFHISRDASEEKLESFKKGIEANLGTGYGGQQSGFYCWTNEEKANECYAMWATGSQAAWAKEKFGKDITLQNGNALKLKIQVDENSIKYPNYQLDNEQHPDKNSGREKSIWLDFWEAQKDLFNKENQVQIEGVLYNMCFDEQNHCPTLISNDKDKKVIKINSTLAEESFRTQAINNYLADKYPSYRDNYNKLIEVIKNDSNFDGNYKFIGFEINNSDWPFLKFIDSNLIWLISDVAVALIIIPNIISLWKLSSVFKNIYDSEINELKS